MNPEETARLEQLERQVAFLYRHLGLNPNLTGSDPGSPVGYGSPPGFSSPADVFGTPAAYGDGRPAAFAPPSFSSAPPQGAVPPPQTAPAAQPVPVAGLVPGPGGCPPAVMEAIQQGKLIAAIKIYRELTGAGLKEAKDAVDGWAGAGRRGRR